MTTTIFLMLLTALSGISGLVTEAIKKLMSDKHNLSYNLLALTVAFIIGTCGSALYYQLNGLVFSANNIIYMILMGCASGLVSMLGYDKVKQTIEQLIDKTE